MSVTIAVPGARRLAGRSLSICPGVLAFAEELGRSPASSPDTSAHPRPARSSIASPWHPQSGATTSNGFPVNDLGDNDDLLGLLSPVALRDFEFDPLALVEGLVAVLLDR